MFIVDFLWMGPLPIGKSRLQHRVAFRLKNNDRKLIVYQLTLISLTQGSHNLSYYLFAIINKKLGGNAVVFKLASLVCQELR